MKNIFDRVSYKVSKLITNEYSTSFSWGIRLFEASVRPPIYAIYGFVRLADEIVDSFHDYDQPKLFDLFLRDYRLALEDRISVNPVLNAFQEVVHQYDLYPLVDTFLESMEMDLNKKSYHSNEEFQKYIYGSADVVGLMCLKVFVKGEEAEFAKLKDYAVRLGSAFQKVNFLRDIQYDMQELGRSYFPNVDFDNLSESQKNEIVSDIKADFQEALVGIKKLPHSCRFGVYVAYRYYLSLLREISLKKADNVVKARIRVSNAKKLLLLKTAFIRYKFNAL